MNGLSMRHMLLQYLPEIQGLASDLSSALGHRASTLVDSEHRMLQLN
jgi:hypothetical protein